MRIQTLGNPRDLRRERRMRARIRSFSVGTNCRNYLQHHRQPAFYLIVPIIAVWALQTVSLARNAKSPTEPSTKSECLSKGGKWEEIRQKGKPTGSYACAVKTSDAGKKCTDSSECEGACMDGRCYEWSRLFHGTCSITTPKGNLCVD